VVERQHITGDDVDVSLGELAVAARLRTFATPDLLDLVTAERKLEAPGVVEDVARERHGEVEVHAEARIALVRIGVQPAQHVDLFVDLAAG